jgi:hypothetical protein
MYPRRAYSTVRGRFLGRDPIEEDGGGNLYASFGNDPIHFTDPLGLINIVVSGTTATLLTKGQDEDTPVSSYLDFAGKYYFGEGNFESRGSMVTILSFGRKWWSAPAGFLADAVRLRPSTFRNLFHANAYLEDVRINGARVAELIEQSPDEQDVVMGHSQGVTLAAAGVAMAAAGNPVQPNKTIKLVLLAPKVGFDALEKYIAEAKASQPCWSIDVLVIGNRYDNDIPCGTQNGYIAHYDPLTKIVRKGGPRAHSRIIQRDGVHYGLGFPLGRPSKHWETVEFADAEAKHDARAHVGVQPLPDGGVVEFQTPQAEAMRTKIRRFIQWSP